MDIKLKNKFFEQERDLQVLYRKLFFQMVIVAILYTVIGIAAYIGIRQILEHIEIFYSLVNWIEVNRVIGFFTYIIVGYIIILIYFWKKPFSYLNDVLIATSSMYGQENKMITLPLLYKKYGHIGSVALVSFLLSLSIEIVQMFGRGATDINDLITNTVGACLGFFIYQLLSKLVSKELCRKFQSYNINEGTELLFFIIYSFVIMVTIQPIIISTLFHLA